jgi:hypothetical protein
LSTSDPFSNVPPVETTFSSPLKNQPLTFDPLPLISNRNGISRPFTTTAASHRPATEEPVSPVCAKTGARAAAGMTSAASNTTSNLFIRLLPKTKSPEVVHLRALLQLTGSLKAASLCVRWY